MKKSRWRRMVKGEGMVLYVRERQKFEKYTVDTAYCTGNLCGATLRLAGGTPWKPPRYFPCEMLFTPGDMRRVLWKEEREREERAERRKQRGTDHDTGGR